MLRPLQKLWSRWAKDCRHVYVARSELCAPGTRSVLLRSQCPAVNQFKIWTLRLVLCNLLHNHNKNSWGKKCGLPDVSEVIKLTLPWLLSKFIWNPKGKLKRLMWDLIIPCQIFTIVFFTFRTVVPWDHWL